MQTGIWEHASVKRGIYKFEGQMCNLGIYFWHNVLLFIELQCTHINFDRIYIYLSYR